MRDPKHNGARAGGSSESVPLENGNYPCRYVALDDQLSGTGWSLL